MFADAFLPPEPESAATESRADFTGQQSPSTDRQKSCDSHLAVAFGRIASLGGGLNRVTASESRLFQFHRSSCSVETHCNRPRRRHRLLAVVEMAAFALLTRAPTMQCLGLGVQLFLDFPFPCPLPPERKNKV